MSAIEYCKCSDSAPHCERGKQLFQIVMLAARTVVDASFSDDKWMIYQLVYLAYKHHMLECARIAICEACNRPYYIVDGYYEQGDEQNGVLSFSYCGDCCHW